MIAVLVLVLVLVLVGPPDKNPLASVVVGGVDGRETREQIYLGSEWLEVVVVLVVLVVVLVILLLCFGRGGAGVSFFPLLLARMNEPRGQIE